MDNGDIVSWSGHAGPHERAIERRGIKSRLFGIDLREATFAQRGFSTTNQAKTRRLETIGVTFIRGYMAALEQTDGQRLGANLDSYDPGVRGFAYEGAAMAMALLDHMLPWRRSRLALFINGPAKNHIYMAHVGAGWALARLRRGTNRYFHKLDPLLRWLAMDGYGFHEGYFHWQRTIEVRQQPRRLRGYARNAFDQGVGRSLWFVRGADVEHIAHTIAAFAPARHPDLWSGVGLAAAYAGGVTRSELEALRKTAGAHQANMAQGAAFAAEARERGGNPAAHTDMACSVLCNMTAAGAADIARQMRQDLPATGDGTAYTLWRQRIRDRLRRKSAQDAI